MCFHRDTTRGFASISVHYTLRATAPTEGTENTSQEETRIADARSADACPSLARVALSLCVVVKWSGYVQQGTGAQVLTVGQEYLLLGTDVQHSEVQNLLSLLNAPPPSVLF